MLPILSFELRQRLRQPPFYVAAAVLFTYWFFFTLDLEHDPNFWGERGEVFYNAPAVLYFLLTVQAFVTFVIVPVFMASPLLRDLEQRTAETLYALPISASALFWGRFLGSFLALCACVMLASTAIVLAPHAAVLLGRIQPERVRGLPLRQLGFAWIWFVWPTLFAASGLVFSLAALSRRASAALAATVILILGAAVAHRFRGSRSELLEWLDITGFQALHRATAYWTVEQRNAGALPLEGTLLYNRALCIGIGLASTGVAWARFGFARFFLGHDARAPRSAESSSEPVDGRGLGLGPERAEGPGWLTCLIPGARFELAALLRDPLCSLVLVLCFVWAAAQDIALLGASLAGQLPVTASMLEARRGLWMLTFVLVPFVATSSLFRERSRGVSEMLDALPAPGWLRYASKLLAVALYLALIPALVLLAGLGVQVFHGYFALELDSYLLGLFGSYYPYLLQMAAFAFGIAALARTQARAFALVALVLYAGIFAHETGVLEHPLLSQMYEARVRHSAFHGFAPHAGRLVAYALYWLSLGALVCSAGGLLWTRGVQQGLRQRLRVARARLTPSVRGWLAALAGVCVVLASWIAYNENVLNEYRSHTAELDVAADYERRYRPAPGEPAPTVSHAAVSVRLEPEQRAARVEARLTLRNPGLSPLRTLNVETPDGARLAGLELSERAAVPSALDLRHRRARFELEPALTAGASRELKTTVQVESRGFSSAAEPAWVVAPGGTFWRDGLLPRFGYDASREIDVAAERAKRGLPERADEPSDAFPFDAAKDAVAGAASWDVAIDAPLGTLAVAPGRLCAREERGQRQLFHYCSIGAGSPLALFAAPYAATRGEWTGPGQPKVAIEILSLPAHRANTQHFLDAAQRALEFLTPVLGPYPYSELRVAEIPAGAPALLAANLIGVPEDSGWLGDYRAGKKPDFIYHLVAQQLARQWLLALPASKPRGRRVLLDGVPEYLALRFVELHFGSELSIHKYVSRALHRYFWYHGIHRGEEPALSERVDNPFVAVDKGGLALRAISARAGEDSLLEILRASLREPHSPAERFQELLRALDTPDEPELVRELFDDVVTYEHRIAGATAHATRDGRFRLDVTLDFAVNGRERRDARALARPRHVELGVVTRDAQGVDALHIEALSISAGRQEYASVLEREPRSVEIDPRRLLIAPELGRSRQSIELATE